MVIVEMLDYVIEVPLWWALMVGAFTFIFGAYAGYTYGVDAAIADDVESRR